MFLTTYIKSNKLFSYFILGVFITSFLSCKKKGCTDSNSLNYDENAQVNDGSCEYKDSYNVMLTFDHLYNGLSVTQSDLDVIKFNNLAGNEHSISKLQYLISSIIFYKSSGDSVTIDGYNLIDMSNLNSFNYDLSTVPIEEGSYNGIGLVFGFTEDDNINGAYLDLNSASWSWPEMLGGGYHFMKFEGKFIDATNDTTNFTYHMGTAREITMNDTVFHDNHVFVKIDTAFSITNNATINLKVNLEEWFENPNTWDLNQYSNMLMSNYIAQVMMKENGTTVFTWNSISQ